MKRIIVIAAATVIALVQAPGSAAISDGSLVASNNQVDATGVTYTLTGKVGIAALSFAVILPSGVTGLDTANVTVETSTDGTSFSAATLAGANPKLESADGQRLGVNLASALTAGNWIKITITGLSNPGSTGDYTITLGDKLTAITQLDLDSTLSALLTLLTETLDSILTIVSEVTNGISTNVSVAPALSLSASASSHSWSLDPSGTTSSTSTSDTLSISTNAATYVIQGKISGDLIRVGTAGTSESDLIPNDGASSDPHFGYTVSGPSGDSVNSSTFRTFSTSYASLASGWSLSGLTNGEDTTVTYDLKVDYTKAPGTYAAAITYRIVPTY